MPSAVRIVILCDVATEGSVDLSFDGKIAILTLNNVPKKNAMTYLSTIYFTYREKMMVDLAKYPKIT